ncbi:unnamed protein product [Heterosigma akashiwo]|mmetsp:Transcript_4223/g.5945  ORF Transcript_4223/g.5945 Transcript_4223/m.5945 type:complete len:133 (-) Transcript_4223:239-637(-)|eukprot:CAMPEP_0194573874 /NCGR_PEP_ID=MMETSP0292-20121207/9939_1 /TAXON_ID=39354 /ORGANISM="Heterosigma akashiwo, Strain CCMP2393" /LENGTH=132 /DNA_ID=CAMNT_0039425259 /DNA_START=47 /DNA_END=445 /DNA_ORIENTATION=+
MAKILGGTPFQDIAPAGGYPKIDVRNSNRVRGPSGIALFAGAAAVTFYGFYKIGQGNIARREAKWEKRDARMAIIPFLQAEEDQQFLKRQAAWNRKEAEVMAGVPGWKAGESVYKSGVQWMPPAISRKFLEG